MEPFVPYFLHIASPPYPRIATSQKCLRVAGAKSDINKVGKTPRHLTFLEMLGNFSFGDYYKKEAIKWAWEFMTEQLAIPPSKLWVSVYIDDDEAEEIWKNIVGIPQKRIVRLKEDNFWDMGPTGPCGPCSEIFYDLEIPGCSNPECKPGCSCERFIEVWNLVFQQYNRLEDGTLEPLPVKCIDTGMGLERLAMVCQKKSSVFDTDLFLPIREKIREIVGGRKIEKTSEAIIADHSRAFTFIISDGILPSNEGRGYVLRYIIRRAIRQGVLVGINEPFLYKLVPVIIEEFKDAYQELVENRELIKNVVKLEEENFYRTLKQGSILLSEELNKMESRGEKVLKGEIAFKLYDTYGFPLDLTKEISAERGFTVEEESYNRLMTKQKELSRTARENEKEKELLSLPSLPPTQFSGYEETEGRGVVLAILKANADKEDTTKGERIKVVLDTTPFYAESGGEVADTGIIEGENFKGNVIDVKKDAGEHFIHLVEGKGILKVGEVVKLTVNRNFRRGVAQHHTATHLLNSALRKVVGSHIVQAGSLVTPDRLRFDFTHSTALTEEEKTKVEAMVNEKIWSNLPVETLVLPIEEAKQLGAMALFGEKYGEVVRVKKIDEFSLEFCGGIHTKTTGEIGLVKIIKEESIGAGIRRIEAVAGDSALKYLQELEKTVTTLTNLLKTSPQDLVKSVEEKLNIIKEEEKKISLLESKLLKYLLEEKIFPQVKNIKGVYLLATDVPVKEVATLREAGDYLRSKFSPGIFLLISKGDQKVTLLVLVSPEISKIYRWADAGKLAKEYSKILEGSGGGSPTLGQGGGKNIQKVDELIKKFYEFIKNRLEEEL